MHHRRRWGTRGDRRRGGWRDPGKHPPPWWPDDEQWPPHDAAGLRRLRQGFMRRMAVFGCIGVILAAVVFGAVVGAIASVAGTTPSVVLGSSIAFLIFVALVRWIVMWFRSSAAPLGDLIEASGRVEAGELDVHVPERGVREVRTLTRAFNAMSSRLSVTERERRRLLAEISHELRTPLTVIQGNVEAMIDGVYPADRERLERVQSETRQLARLIDDLRTLSLAETGQLRLTREPTDLADLARDVAAGFEADASAVGVVLKVEATDDLADSDVDPFRMRQVLANLVSNALRHTPSGGEINVRVQAAREGFEITVTDTGSGMSAEAIAHAFDRFWRSGESAGAGLGLAIVRDLVAAHGGTVSIASNPGAGTTVTLRLPA